MTQKFESVGQNDNVENKNFLFKYKYDIAFILAIFILLISFYVIFGAFVPIEAVASGSMSPHIDKGDIIFYTVINKISKIETKDKHNTVNFEDYGDVIIYKPFGQEGIVPYVHRAMYYVNQSDEMWSDGPKAPYAGFITKGDNNGQLDQQLDLSREKPIKKEWIIGVVRFRIPYIGYIKLI